MQFTFNNKWSYFSERFHCANFVLLLIVQFLFFADWEPRILLMDVRPPGPQKGLREWVVDFCDWKWPVYIQLHIANNMMDGGGGDERMGWVWRKVAQVFWWMSIEEPLWSDFLCVAVSIRWSTRTPSTSLVIRWCWMDGWIVVAWYSPPPPHPLPLMYVRVRRPIGAEKIDWMAGWMDGWMSE